MWLAADVPLSAMRSRRFSLRRFSLRHPKGGYHSQAKPSASNMLAAAAIAVSAGEINRHDWYWRGDATNAKPTPPASVKQAAVDGEGRASRTGRRRRVGDRGGRGNAALEPSGSVPTGRRAWRLIGSEIVVDARPRQWASWPDCRSRRRSRLEVVPTLRRLARGGRDAGQRVGAGRGAERLLIGARDSRAGADGGGIRRRFLHCASTPTATLFAPVASRAVTHTPTPALPADELSAHRDRSGGDGAVADGDRVRSGGMGIRSRRRKDCAPVACAPKPKAAALAPVATELLPTAVLLSAVAVGSRAIADRDVEAARCRCAFGAGAGRDVRR